MVRHNNMIANGHFHKKWQRHVKTWFNQPALKLKRNKRRITKANKMAPRPTELLRPIVHCPSARYNLKLRTGRGFTLQELKAANVTRHFARSIGIAVDYRRKNKSYESLQQNVFRLKNYVSRLIVYPLNKKKAKAVQPEKFLTEGLNEIKQPVALKKVRVPTEEEKGFDAFLTLRKARSEGMRLSRKNKRKTKEDNFDVDKK